MNAAKPRTQARRTTRGQLRWTAITILAILLCVPGYALSQWSAAADGWLLVGVPLALSVFAFFAYQADKRRAETGDWRISEATLHLIGLLGGWPGAFVAQRLFRHKTSKLSFQLVFWCVVALHQYLAIDSLLDWRFTGEAFRFVRTRI